MNILLCRELNFLYHYLIDIFLQKFANNGIDPSLFFQLNSKDMIVFFENKEINTRTYLVFNPKSDIKNVRFSDGFILEAKPKSLTKSTKKL